jgi:hypothetical protein
MLKSVVGIYSTPFLLAPSGNLEQAGKKSIQQLTRGNTTA